MLGVKRHAAIAFSEPLSDRLRSVQGGACTPGFYVSFTPRRGIHIAPLRPPMISSRFI